MCKRYYVSFNTGKTNNASLLALANVEALADGESMTDEEYTDKTGCVAIWEPLVLTDIVFLWVSRGRWLSPVSDFFSFYNMFRKDRDIVLPFLQVYNSHISGCAKRTYF